MQMRRLFCVPLLVLSICMISVLLEYSTMKPVLPDLPDGLCDEGWHCPQTMTQWQLYQICPAGFYCPNSTETGRQFPCPEVTYSNTTGLESLAECRDCPEGYRYCVLRSVTPTLSFFHYATLVGLMIILVYPLLKQTEEDVPGLL